MICNKCKNRFANINGLKFCPYCGEKIEEKIDGESLEAASAREKKRQFTQEMPAITDEVIKKDKREKFVASIKKTFMHRKVIIPIISLLVIIVVVALAYSFFIIKPVDEVRIKEDLLGEVVTLPKGTKIKINENNMKNLTINSSSIDKSRDDVKIALTLNNGVIEAKAILSLEYINEDKSEWKFNKQVSLDSVTSVKPVMVMNGKKLMSELNKRSVTIDSAEVALGGQDVKKLAISLRTPDLENGKEEVLLEVSIDSGLICDFWKDKV